uniref:hypothetical protein n=1 Tax=Acidovorax sp. SUPP3334 TaxID=2920881 RepID=UPI0029529337|nr:hypothetical protein [Acidovorax sp. SUPP3334]BDH38362.1 hypothetical protein AVHM3334_23185 [Acidovorax sp. SUPP3334]
MAAVLATAFAAALTACGKPDEPTSPQTAKFDCNALPDPSPTDDSAAARATASAQGSAAREACKKSPRSDQDIARADLARIREIKEKEQRELADKKISEKEWGKQLNKGADTPIKEYKY